MARGHGTPHGTRVVASKASGRRRWPPLTRRSQSGRAMLLIENVHRDHEVPAAGEQHDMQDRRHGPMWVDDISRSGFATRTTSASAAAVFSGPWPMLSARTPRPSSLVQEHTTSVLQGRRNRDRGITIRESRLALSDRDAHLRDLRAAADPRRRRCGSSAEHEGLLAGAISEKVAQNSAVQIALQETGTARLIFPLTFSRELGCLARVTPLALMIERWKRRPRTAGSL